MGRTERGAGCLGRNYAPLFIIELTKTLNETAERVHALGFLPEDYSRLLEPEPLKRDLGVRQHHRPDSRGAEPCNRSKGVGIPIQDIMTMTPEMLWRSLADARLERLNRENAAMRASLALVCQEHKRHIEAKQVAGQGVPMLSLAEVEARHIRTVVLSTRTLAEASAVLKINESTLYRKWKALGLPPRR
jgi:hypothetical protein